MRASRTALLVLTAGCAAGPAPKPPSSPAVAARGGFRVDADAPRPCGRWMTPIGLPEPRHAPPGPVTDVRRYHYADAPTTCVLPVHLAATGLVACASRHTDAPGGTASYRYDDAGRLIAIDYGSSVDRFGWSEDTLAEVQAAGEAPMPVTVDGDHVLVGDAAHPWRTARVVDGRPVEIGGDDQWTVRLRWRSATLTELADSRWATTVVDGKPVLGKVMAFDYADRCRDR